KATTRPITAAARAASTIQTQVGVELSEPALVVVGAVGVTFSVVVCSTVVTTVDAGSVCVSETVVVTGTVSVVVMSATPVAASPPASRRPAAKSAANPTTRFIPVTQAPHGHSVVIQPGTFDGRVAARG